MAPRKYESFVVGGRELSYRDDGNEAGFGQTAGSGGPIREGLRVRSHHDGNAIARLEVASCP